MLVKMEKRGQVTVFIILGIIIVAVIVILLSLKPEIISTPATPENLNKVMNDINKHIKQCLAASAEEPLNRIALQGGYLNVPDESYRLWDDTTVSYLCYDLPNTDSCMNRMLTKKHMEDELENAVKEKVMQCLDVQEFASQGIIKTYDVLTKPDKLDLNLVINRDNVVIELKYPITLKSSKNGNDITRDKFTVIVDKPLGELYEVVQDILDAETTYGRFDTLTYMLSKLSRYTIYLHKPYPDKIYQVKLREKDYMFQFAIEGEPL